MITFPTSFVEEGWIGGATLLSVLSSYSDILSKSLLYTF